MGFSWECPKMPGDNSSGRTWCSCTSPWQDTQVPAPSGEVRSWPMPWEPGKHKLPPALSCRESGFEFLSGSPTPLHVAAGSGRLSCCWETGSKAQPYLAGVCTSTSLTSYPYKKVYSIHPKGLCCMWFQTLEDRPRGHIIMVESISIRGRMASNFHCHYNLNLILENKLISSSPGEFKIEHVLMLEFKIVLCFLLNFQLLWDKNLLFK